MNEYIAGAGLYNLLYGRPDLIGAEIGVNTGVTSEFLLKNLEINKLYCIDPWQAYGHTNPSAGSTHFTEEDALKHLNETVNRTSFAGDRVVIQKTTSEIAARNMLNHYLDFVFIDGDHSYEEVKKDLKLWYPKVKTGGIFAGHDFSHGDVNRALKEFLFSILKQPKISFNDMWYIVK